ncbi:MAG TPA: sigma 54-interacting transcriptional regulator [Vicinamibacterales bacterium]|nr:sigma 54-interacting transcriptional regulator [Vicinamibacterales bacterium]
MIDEAALDSAHLSRYDALLRTSKTLATHRTIGELVRVLGEELHPIIPFDYLALLLHDERSNELRLVILEPPGLAPPIVSKPIAEHGPAATVWETQKTAVIPIPETGPLHQVPAYLRSQGLRMACYLPLTTAHRQIGILAFGSRSDAVYTDDTVAFMEQVAAIVAIAVENGINRDEAQRYELEVREERDRLQFLLDINNLLISQPDYRTLLETICDTVQRIAEADHVGVALYDPDSEQLRLDLIYDRAHGFSTSGAMIPLNESAAGITFQRGSAGIFRRAEMEQRGWIGASLMKTEGVESMCCVPLVTRNGKLGTLYVGSPRPDAFSEGDVTLLGHASTQIAIALENARAYERLASLNAQLADEKQYLEVELQHEFGEIVGTSPALRNVLSAVKTVAPTETTVLLLGETGTGKELFARAIHRLSARRDRPFVRTSVAALPATLLESELFGHEKGAFTGAAVSRAGRLEVANRGTLFLDEVGDIPMEMQPKLLRVLQEREFERLGSTRTQRIDVRIVAATNRDFDRMIEEGSFRSDLYYRLSVFPITIPPLRERAGDIPALAWHFVTQCARRLGRAVPTIPDAAMDALVRWSWPGNIRELQNVIERAVILSHSGTLVLPFQDLKAKTSKTSTSPKPAATLKDAERETILRALRESGGVIAGPSGAAARLGLQRTTLQSKMRKLGIKRPSF